MSAASREEVRQGDGGAVCAVRHARLVGTAAAQINAIAEVLETNLPISLPRIAIGIIFGSVTAIIIIGGIESIGLCAKSWCR
ncbi:MAG: hypothetical protein ACLSGI_01675 [Butyricicoccaceae bacterium]